MEVDAFSFLIRITVAQACPYCSCDRIAMNNIPLAVDCNSANEVVEATWPALPNRGIRSILL